jgi:hypothetical protein
MLRPTIFRAVIYSLSCSLLSTLLAGCQTWSTTVLTVPASHESEVRSAISAVSLANGMRPCAEWKIRVKDAQECFGGGIDAGSVTVATFSNGMDYVVKIGLYSSGRYDKHAFEVLELKYRHALEDLFPTESVVRTELRELIVVERDRN